MFFRVWVEEEPSQWTDETERVIANGNLLTFAVFHALLDRYMNPHSTALGSSMHYYFFSFYP